MATQMDAYVLFRRAAEMMVAPRVAYDEQDEDIGSASDSECTSRSSAASSSSDLADDASSSSSSSSCADHFEMSALMTQLPIKRGLSLSMFFDGKSQSFASLAAVASLEDLAKPAKKRLKPSRSCGGGLDAHRGRFLSLRRLPQGRRRKEGVCEGRLLAFLMDRTHDHTAARLLHNSSRCIRTKCTTQNLAGAHANTAHANTGTRTHARVHSNTKWARGTYRASKFFVGSV